MTYPIPIDGCYCAARSHLEDRESVLVSHLFDLLQMMQEAVGGDHDEFLAIRARCFATRSEIAECRAERMDHRAQHGC